MDAKTHFLIPSIHIKKEVISDDETENSGQHEFLQYFDKSADLSLGRMVPTVVSNSEMSVMTAGKDTYSVGREEILQLQPYQNLAFTDVNQNVAGSEPGNDKEFEDFLSKTIDEVARGLFESNNDRNWIPEIKPKTKTPIVRRKVPQQRLYHETLKNSKNLSLHLSKPFEMHWRRELVHRATNTERKHNADAYYFSPSGKKFRSLPEVAAYLEETNEKILDISSFTFHKTRISDHPNESERFAKRQIDARESKKSTKKKVLEDNEPKIKQVSDDDSSSSSIWQKTDTEEESRKRASSIMCLVSEPNDVTTSDKSHCEAKEARSMEVNGENNVEDGEMPKCSTYCQGQEGVIPSLHCHNCLCLFHPQCIGLADSKLEIVQFTCKECRNKQSTQEIPMTRVLQVKKANRQASNDVRSRTSSMSAHSSWKISNFQPNSASSHQKIVLVKTTSTNANDPVVTKRVKLPFNEVIDSGSTKHLPGGITIEKVANVVSKIGPTEPDAASISLIRVTQPGPVLTSQTSTVAMSNSVFQRNMNLLPVPLSQGVIMPCNIIQPNQYIAPRTIQQRSIVQEVNSSPIGVVNPAPFTTQIVLPTNGMLSCATASVPRLLPPLAQAIHTYSRSPKNSAVMPTLTSTNVNSMKLALADRLNHDHAYNKHNSPSSIKSSKLAFSSSNSEVCWINALPGGHEGLLHIFRYFPLSDLMRATQVCKAWKSAIKHPSMWRHVSLRNMKIICWETFSKLIQERGTQHLDMRGMCLYEDKNRTWHEFAAILSQLKGLSRLDIGEVPAAIVHTVANTLSQLEGLSAEWIVDSTKDAHNATGNCRLFIAKLCELPNLKFLRIRGVYGLYLPSPSFGLDCLECLKHIKHLSLTSIKYQTAPDLNFLKSLPCLSTLELGDCHEWSIESYKSIGHLTQLRNLRLEFEEKSSCTGLDVALRGLKNLVRLDLIVFQIPWTLGDVLTGLTNLKNLSIWPDVSAQAAVNNYNTLQGLKNVPFLKSFTWGLVTSNLPDSRPGQKFDYQANNVPFLAANDNGELTEVKINASTLMGRLRTTLPFSKVQVMMVPNSSYSTIGCMPR